MFSDLLCVGGHFRQNSLGAIGISFCHSVSQLFGQFRTDFGKIVDEVERVLDLVGNTGGERTE